MIANFFNKTKPIVHFIITIGLLVYFVSANLLFNLNEFSTLFLAERAGIFLGFIVMLLILNFIIQKNNLTQNNSYALLIVALLLGTFYETMFSNVLLFTNITLLLGFRKVYSLRSGTNTKQKIFDAGFWVGISALIDPWSIFYVALIYLAILIYQKMDVRNIFIPLIGIATPVFIFFTYCFYFDNLELFYGSWMFNPNLDFGNYNQFKYLMPIAFLLTLLIWSIVVLTPKIGTEGINVKRSWRLVLNHLLISVFIIISSPVKNGSELFYMVFPLSIIVANFLKKSATKSFKNLILYFILAISIVVYFL